MNISIGNYGDAEFLIKKYHYSKRMPGNIQYIFTMHDIGGLYGDMGKPLAACIFSVPPTRWGETVWELSRLVKSDDCNIYLSGFISECLKYLNGKQDLIVSFADSTQDHHGGIYQACSWNYHGFRMPSCDGLIINGSFVPGRSCNSKYGTRSATILLEKYNIIADKHFDTGKYLYWKALSKSGIKKASRLGLQINKYPKPARSVEE